MAGVMNQPSKQTARDVILDSRAEAAQQVAATYPDGTLQRREKTCDH